MKSLRQLDKAMVKHSHTIIQQAFADEHGLLLRKRIHEEYSIPQVNLQEWVLNRFTWRGDEAVLDIGAGPGTYWHALQSRLPNGIYVGGDLSEGMLRAHHNKTQSDRLATFDAERLPFPDQSFDVVLANHMLHYASNVDVVIAEIHRVLKSPNGILIAATNSEYTMPEFNTLMQRAVRLLRRSARDEFSEEGLTSAFSLEKGSVLLARQFQSVARYDVPNAFVFHDTQPIVDYLESCRPFYELRLPQDIMWEEFMTIMSDQVRRLVDHFGELVVNKLTGVLIATDEGGFAQDYQKLRHKLNAG